MGEFTVSKGVREGFKVFVVDGEIDEMTAPQVDAALEGCRDGWLLVDMSRVEFISSAGLHVLLEVRPARIAVVSPPPRIARVFDAVEAERRVPIFPDLDIAIQMLTQCESTYLSRLERSAS